MSNTVGWNNYNNNGAAIGNANLNNLNNNNLAIGGEIDFAALGGWPYYDLEANLGAVDLSAGVGQCIYVWLLTAPDGTNYENGANGTGDDNNCPGRPPDAIIPLQKRNSAQRVVIKGLLAPPCKAKFLVQWKPGAAQLLNSNNNSVLNYYLYGAKIT